MEIKKLLKQLNQIQPDPDYVRVSKARLMEAAVTSEKLTLRGFVLGILRSGSAMAVTGLVLFLALGGFSLYTLIGSVSGLDDSLRAEARAISTQLHLAELQYRDGGYGRRSLIVSKQNFVADEFDPSAPDVVLDPDVIVDEDVPSDEDSSGGDTDSDADTDTAPEGEGEDQEGDETDSDQEGSDSDSDSENGDSEDADGADADSDSGSGSDEDTDGDSGTDEDAEDSRPQPVGVKRVLDILSR